MIFSDSLYSDLPISSTEHMVLVHVEEVFDITLHIEQGMDISLSLE